MRPKSVRLRSAHLGLGAKETADVLAEEVRLLDHWARARPGPYATSGWDGISLIQGDGRADDTRSPMPSRVGAGPTAALAECPHLGALLESLPGPILVARLLYLEPNGSAGLHRDPIGVPLGVVRLHVPIITHPDVELWLGGERMQWRAGELWYGDFAYPHRLANPSSITRVHLVLDVCVSDRLLDLFPTELVPSMIEGGVYKARPRQSLSRNALLPFEKSIHLPNHSFPGIPLPEELDVLIDPDDDTSLIAVSKGGGGESAPVLTLDPIDDSTLAIRGYYPGVTLAYSHASGAIELVHRGRVRLPEGAADDEQTPFELFTTEWRVDASS